jgi:hypothetical protein
VRRFIEKDREIQRQIRQIKEEQIFNQDNRPPTQKPPQERDGQDLLEDDGLDLLHLFP